MCVKVCSYGMGVVLVDGMNVSVVCDVICYVVVYVCCGDGLMFVEFWIYCFCVYFMFDVEFYCDKVEVELWK